MRNGARISTQPAGFLTVRKQEEHAFDQFIDIAGDIARFAVQDDSWKFSRCKGYDGHTNAHGLDYSQRQAGITNWAEQEPVVPDKPMQVPVWNIAQPPQTSGPQANS